MKRILSSSYSTASNDNFPLRPQLSQRPAFIDFRRSQCNVPRLHTSPAVGLFEDFDFGPSNILFQPLQPSLPVMETSPSFFISSASTLLSRALPAILGALSYAITSLISLFLPMASQLQRTGETLLAAFLFLSFIQAFVAMYQYQYDVRGQLVFPDGLTLGKEDYYGHDNGVKTDENGMADNNIIDDQSQSQEAAASPNIITHVPSTVTTTIDDNFSWSTQVVKKLNKSLVLLLPWITRNVHNLLTRNAHLFHIGFIVFILDSLLPFVLDGDESEVVAADNMGKKVKVDPSFSSLLKKVTTHQGLSPSSTNKDPIRILVIGDSLAVGIGCIEQFDATKDSSVPMALVENTAETTSHSGQGPVFPQILARTLSYHFKKPVQWRSAGVDGGDVNDIRSFTMDVVKQECTKGVDIVVVLFGMNDLKSLLSTNPLQHLFHSGDGGGGITSRFRNGMDLLLSDIHSYAPDALVVFPTLPIQGLHKNSIINVFPMGLMVDAFMGVWERQKKIVSSRRENTMYVELTANEIADWYAAPDTANYGKTLETKNYLDGDDDFRVGDDFGNDIKDDVLMSADGVHPNKKMYAKWGELVGHKLYKHIVPRIELVDQKHDGWHSKEKDEHHNGKGLTKSTEKNRLQA